MSRRIHTCFQFLLDPFSSDLSGASYLAEATSWHSLSCAQQLPLLQKLLSQCFTYLVFYLTLPLKCDSLVRKFCVCVSVLSSRIALYLKQSWLSKVSENKHKYDQVCVRWSQPMGTGIPPSERVIKAFSVICFQRSNHLVSKHYAWEDFFKASIGINTNIPDLIRQEVPPLLSVNCF